MTTCFGHILYLKKKKEQKKNKRNTEIQNQNKTLYSKMYFTIYHKQSKYNNKVSKSKKSMTLK